MKDTAVIVGMAAIAVVIGVVIFLNGDGRSQAAAVPFTKIVSGTQSQVTARVNYLVTSQEELTKLWDMISTTAKPPNVDFTKEVVIAVFAGQQPTTGYAIVVSRIEDSTARMVSLTIEKPGAGCVTGQAVTAPYEIVAVPLTTLPLTHADESTTTSCPK